MASMPHFSSSWPSQLCTGPSDCSEDIFEEDTGTDKEKARETLSGAGPAESPLIGRMRLGWRHSQMKIHVPKQPWKCKRERYERDRADIVEEEEFNPARQTQEGLHEESCRIFCIFVLLQARGGSNLQAWLWPLEANSLLNRLTFIHRGSSWRTAGPRLNLKEKKRKTSRI